MKTERYRLTKSVIKMGITVKIYQIFLVATLIPILLAATLIPILQTPTLTLIFLNVGSVLMKVREVLNAKEQDLVAADGVEILVGPGDLGMTQIKEVVGVHINGKWNVGE